MACSCNHSQHFHRRSVIYCESNLKMCGLYVDKIWWEKSENHKNYKPYIFWNYAMFNPQSNSILHFRFIENIKMPEKWKKKKNFQKIAPKHNERETFISHATVDVKYSKQKCKYCHAILPIDKHNTGIWCIINCHKFLFSSSSFYNIVVLIVQSQIIKLFHKKLNYFYLQNVNN